MVDAPRRGEIFEVNWDPARGSEQAGRRPALVVQNDIGNSASPMTIVAAITSKEPRKSYPFMVELTDAHLPKRSWANCSQLYTIDETRLGRMMGAVSSEAMVQVDNALVHALQLPKCTIH